MQKFLSLLIKALVFGLIICLPLTWTSTTSELFELPKMMLVYTFTILIASAWIDRMIVSRDFNFHKSPLNLPVMLFLLSQIISTVLSIDIHTSIFGYYSRFHGGLLSTIAYTLLYFAIINNLSKKDIPAMLASILIGGSIASVYALPEHFGHSPSCLLITGNFNASCWVQDVQTRVFGTFGQPNWLAAYLISIIFFPMAYLTYKHRQTTTTSQALSLLSFSLFFIVLLFTKSRSGLFGFAGGFLALACSSFILKNHAPSKSSPLNRIKPLAVFPILALVIFAFFGKGIIPQLDRFFIHHKTAPAATQSPSGTQLESGGTESGQIRKIVWQGAVKIFQSSPIFGTGVETFAYSYYKARPIAHNHVSEWDFLYNKAHNEFLNFLANSGLIGFSAYVFLLASLIALCLKHLNNSHNMHESYVLAGIIAGTTALSISNFFGFSTVPVGVLLYVFFGLTVLLHKHPTKTHPKASQLQAIQYAALSIVFTLTLLLLAQVHRMLAADKAFATGRKLVQSGNIAQAISSLESAVQLRPKEPTFTDQLSFVTAQAASLLHANGESTSSAALTNQAIALSDYTLALNDDHLNFYKTRARTFIQLTNIDPSYLDTAKKTLEQAITLAPTDPKLVYNLGLLYFQQEDYPSAIKYLSQAIQLKPDYVDPRVTLGDVYLAQNLPEKAQAEYQYILENLKPDDPVVIEKLNQSLKLQKP